MSGVLELEGSATDMCSSTSLLKPAQRSDAQRVGGLNGWKYADTFGSIALSLDDADGRLDARFVEEANSVVEKVKREIRRARYKTGAIDEMSILRVDVLNRFLPLSVLEKLKWHVNGALSERHNEQATTEELRACIVTHVIDAFYGVSVSTINSRDQKEFYFQIGIKSKRYD